MVTTMLIMMREGMEAALIVGILLAYLVRVGRADQCRNIWIGTGAALAASLVIGVVIFLTAGNLEGSTKQIFEGVATTTAVGVLTWMIFWMRKQAINIKRELQAQIDSVLKTASLVAMPALAFLAVIREGIETVLFMFAAVKATAPVASAVGAAIGLGIAFVLGYLVYKGGTRINLRLFFTATGGLIILVAAGLLAYGLREFIAAGLVDPVVKQVWNIKPVLDENGLLGTVLKGIFGYNDNPSLVEVLGYLGYLTFAGWFFFRPASKPRSLPLEQPQGLRAKA